MFVKRVPYRLFLRECVLIWAFLRISLSEISYFQGEVDKKLSSLIYNVTKMDLMLGEEKGE